MESGMEEVLESNKYMLLLSENFCMINHTIFYDHMLHSNVTIVM